jgi:hypothetical protein
MSDNAPLKPLKEKIVIDQTTDGGKDLHNCFFMPSDVEGYYNFYDRHGRVLATGISGNTPFPFLLDGIAWSIHKLQIDPSKASGEWRNNVTVSATNVGPSNAQDGTFQAESGGGQEEEDAEPSCTIPSNAIEIKTVTGGADKDKLKHCYFVPAATTGQYDFYSKHCNLLASGLSSGNGFSFTHDSITWTVTNFVIDDEEASGNWSNPDEIVNGQDGTFQAESGGGAGEGEGAASAASA